MLPLSRDVPCRAMNYGPEIMQFDRNKVICCLLATEIADYQAKPIFEQIRLTRDFHELLLDATARVASHNLISAVREDSGLLAFLCDPADCITVALAMRDATLRQDRYGDLQLRIGIDLGKAHIAEDEFGQPQVTGEVAQDAGRLMRQGPPWQISVSRRFVELLLPSAPELVESLEYQGHYSDNMGAPLCWYRAPAPQDIEAKSLSDPMPVISSDVIDSPFQFRFVPITLVMQSVAKLQGQLHRSKPGYALLLLVVVSAIVALSVRVGVEPSAVKATAGVGAVTPQPTAPADPVPFREGVESIVGHLDSSFAPVAPQETFGPNASTPPELINDSQQSLLVPSALTPETTEDDAVGVPLGEPLAPGKGDSAASPEQKQRRSKHQTKNTRNEETPSPGKRDAGSDEMLACARIEVLRKRVECFDNLKYRSPESAQ